MGTRNITQVILDGKTIVSQYGQWDGYPDAAGLEILEFLKDMNRSVFEKQLNNCVCPTNEEIHQSWLDAFKTIEYPKMLKDNSELATEEQKNDVELAQAWENKVKEFEENGMVSMDVSTEFGKHHPTLIRDGGCAILRSIYESTEPVEIQLDLDFVNDSLFCEWAYVVDLDNNVLEVYEGFNKSPVPENNRFQLPDGLDPRETADGEQNYYPVVLFQTFPLDDLPDEKSFLQACNTDDEEEEEDEDEPLMSEETAKLGLIKLMDAVNLMEGDANRDTMIKMVNYLQANLDDFIEAAN